ncbi:hypothetical protein LCGC14_3072560 [marine sediment metagenome]|uniref:Uncharacterized protein n=1 Tax=marine sediment metagenome TaxID=412755 RepID=A0A0F8Z699_9ZZZZ
MDYQDKCRIYMDEYDQTSRDVWLLSWRNDKAIKEMWADQLRKDIFRVSIFDKMRLITMRA